MAAVARYLADTSAPARLRHRPVAEVLGPLIAAVEECEHVTALHYDAGFTEPLAQPAVGPAATTLAGEGCRVAGPAGNEVWRGACHRRDDRSG